MPLPFGLKAPSKGTLIFAGIAGGVSGLLYTSNAHAEKARKRLVERVSFLAERPCGVHDAPRKVTVYITAPPGDGLEKSRNWFREYVKPVLVAGAVDYEIKEARQPGQIEAAVIEDIKKRRRGESKVEHKIEEHTSNPYMTPEFMHKVAKEVKTDGVLAIGRNAYREVLSGLSKGCEANLDEVISSDNNTTDNSTTDNSTTDNNTTDDNTTDNNTTDNITTDNMTTDNMTTDNITTDHLELMQDEQEKKDYFSLPSEFESIMYIPHKNIIGWSNIPYRLYMWYADYKRIEEVGDYVVAAVLNQTRPMTEEDADKGQEEKKYWIGDDCEELKKNDKPIEIDSRILHALRTYSNKT